MRKLSVVFAAMVVSTVGQAQTLSFSFGHDNLAAESRAPLNLQNHPMWDYRVGFLYRDDVSNSMLGHIGVNTLRELGSNAPGLRGGFGVSLYTVDAKGFDVGVLALEFALHYSPPVAARSILSFELGLAPEITTFNDGSDAVFQNVRWAYEIVQQTHILLGYRHLEVGIKDRDDVHLVDGWYGGIERRF